MYQKACPGRQEFIKLFSLRFFAKEFCLAIGNGERMTEINDNKMVYKTLNHNIASKLCGDIGTNPSPFVVDPSKTLHSPSQGNSFVFGLNAGKQSEKIKLSGNGNELYSNII